MKKTILFLLTVIFLSAVSAEPTAYEAAKASSEKDSLEDSLMYLRDTIKDVSVPAEKRALYAFTGSVYEQSGQYDQARECYASAAGIAAGDADKMPKKSSEQLVLDAVRCALSSGDYTTADSYLNSDVRTSSDPLIQSYIKLYSQWSLLCRAETKDDTNEAVIILDAYSVLPSMKAVRPVILLTLWYVTGKNSYADDLIKTFPSSPEAAILTGSVQQLPAPFWYFTPHKGSLVAETPDTNAPAAVESPSEDSADKSVHSDEDAPAKIKKEQLGLFRNRENATRLSDRLKKKGFDAYITSEVRPSGTTYYIVVVDEDAESSMGSKLRSAGFECYPVFD